MNNRRSTHSNNYEQLSLFHKAPKRRQMTSEEKKEYDSLTKNSTQLTLQSILKEEV